MSPYEHVAGLPVTVESTRLERRERETPGFTRVTTTFVLEGAGAVGRGEDVTYEAADHDALQAAPPSLPTGTDTVAGYSRALDDVDLFPEPPSGSSAHHYRRWAVESAMLDLALQQGATSLGGLLGRSYDPVRFVASARLGEEGFGRVESLLAAAPDVELKLDPEPDWTPDLVERLADLDRVRVLDLKGHYEDADVGLDPDPDLYRLVVEGFPEAVVEDPALTDETRPVFEGEEDRVSWDYPITDVESVRQLPFEPAWLNVKPSRFGTVASLLETIEYCEDHGIGMYGGGQFELGVGRRQAQELASLFYPDAPNDLAPTEYNDPELDEDLPASPLRALDPSRGFGWP